MSGWLHRFPSIGRRILQLGLVVVLVDLVVLGLRLLLARLREWFMRELRLMLLPVIGFLLAWELLFDCLLLEVGILLCLVMRIVL